MPCPILGPGFRITGVILRDIIGRDGHKKPWTLYCKSGKK